MPGAVTTISIKDGSGNSKTMRAWDESGAGTGPFSFFTVLGADAVKLAKAEDAVHSSGDEGIQALAVRKDTAAALAGTDGDYAPLEIDANGRLHVIASSGIAGDVAHDGADSGNPLKVGTKAAATLSTATLVAAADRANAVSDVDGALITRGDATLADVVSGAVTDTTGNSTQVIAAAGSGVKVYLTDITLSNSSGAAVVVDVKDGTTIKWTMLVPAGATVTHSFHTPLSGTANTAWNVDGQAAATTLYANYAGFKSKV